jgi:hypothetical protein
MVCVVLEKLKRLEYNDIIIYFVTGKTDNLAEKKCQEYSWGGRGVR